MELDQAIVLLKNVVKGSAVEGQNHFDLTIVATEERPRYQQALMVSQMALRDGKITKEEFNRRVHLE